MLQQLGNLSKITQDVLDAIGVEGQVIIERNMTSRPTWHEPFFRDVPATSLAVMLKSIAAPLVLMPWKDDRVVQNIEKKVKTYTCAPHECTVGIDRDDVLYADLRNYLDQVFAGFPDILPNWLIAQLHDMLVNGHGTGEAYMGLDGLPIFSAAHPIPKKILAAAVQQNYWSDLDLTGANAEIVETTMRAYRADNGLSYNVRPTHLWHSPNLKSTARNILDIATTGGTTNIYYKRWEPLEIEGLTTDNLWGLIQPAYVAKVLNHLHAIETAARWLKVPGDLEKTGQYGNDSDRKVVPGFWMPISKCVHTP